MRDRGEGEEGEVAIYWRWRDPTEPLMVTALACNREQSGTVAEAPVEKTVFFIRQVTGQHRPLKNLATQAS